MAAGQGTVNVVGAAVYTVLSVPASALHDADDDGDGTLDGGELERHEAAIAAEIERRLVVLDGNERARAVRLDLVLSPDHGAAGGRAAQIVALSHTELSAPPTDLHVRCDLFGDGASERALMITATRHPASGTETQVAVLTPEAAEAAFFPPPRAPLGQTMLGPTGRAGGVLFLGGLAALAMIAMKGLRAAARRRIRTRRPQPPRPCPG